MLRSIYSHVDIRSSLLHFTFDAATLDRRIKQRPTLSEAFALFMMLGFLGIFTHLQIQGVFEANDWRDYVYAINGFRGSGFFYADWILPLIELLDLLPGVWGYTVFALLNLAGVWFAIRVFRGPAPHALLNYQMLYVLYYGNISGLIIGALGLFWWSMAHKRWHLAGFALTLACTKYHLGGLIALGLWLLADISWRDRLRILIVPVLISALSLVIYPLWPLHTINRIITIGPKTWGSISLWRWIGPASLVLWLPVVWLRLRPAARMVAICATVALASPYFQQTDLLALFVMPTGWLAVLGNAGIVFYWGQWAALRILVIVPLIAYLAMIGPPLRAVWQSRHPAASETG